MTATARSERGLFSRHAWIWDALPPSRKTAVSRGDPTLCRYLEDSGIDSPRSGNTDALLIELPTGVNRADLRRLVEPPPGVEYVAVAVGGGTREPPKPVSVPVRGMQLLLLTPLASARAAATALRVARLLRSRGFETGWTATGDRSRKYGIGRGGWIARRRLPVGWVVSATRNAEPSIVSAAIATAAAAVGAALERHGATVYETGKLQVDLVGGDGRRYILRLAAGLARRPLSQSVDATCAIAAAPSMPEVAERLALPAARGEVGPAEFSLEPVIAGMPPVRITDRLATDALRFLEALRHTSTERTGVLCAAKTDVQAERLFPFLDREERTALSRIAARVEDRVGPLRAGMAHGDFWRENLIVRGGRLVGVVDWEWAVRDALPLLDLFDFVTLAHRRVSQPTPGVRFTSLLWPSLARGRTDPLIERYCLAAAVPDEAAALKALAIAYWLDRTSRDLLPWRDRPRPSGWFESNIHAPLATLVAAGW